MTSTYSTSPKLATMNLDDPIGFYDGLLKGGAIIMARPELETIRKEVLTSWSKVEHSKRVESYHKLLSDIYNDHDDQFFRNLLYEIETSPNDALENFINRKQTACKLWLVNQLAECQLNDVKRISVLGGWFGALSYLILRDSRFNQVENITSFDLDENATEVALRVNSHYVKNNKFDAVTEDMFKMDYQNLDTDLIVNTSCEHIESVEDWIALVPNGTKLILQSNNYFEVDEHINCVHYLKEFEKQAPLSKVFYSGEFETQKYTRFMIIGEK